MTTPPKVPRPNRHRLPIQLVAPIVALLGVVLGAALNHWVSMDMLLTQRQIAEKSAVASKRAEIADRFVGLLAKAHHIEHIYRVWQDLHKRANRGDTAAQKLEVEYGDKLAQFSVDYDVLKYQIIYFYGKETRREFLALEDAVKLDPGVTRWEKMRERHEKLLGAMWEEMMDGSPVPLPGKTEAESKPK